MDLFPQYDRKNYFGESKISVVFPPQNEGISMDSTLEKPKRDFDSQNLI